MAAERELSIKITGDTRGLGRAFGQVDREASKMERGLGGLRRGFGTLAKASGVAVVALGAASVAFGKTAVDAASDLDESLNKSGEVFKKHGDAVAKWSKDSATAMGLSQAAALEGASSIGAMLTPMGIAPKRAADMSRSMVELAGDMASFNNEDPTEMLDRIRSGLSGESEPLKRFGSVLSETRVAQFAYAEGIAATGEKLTEQEKIQARYGLLLKDTADQQGDFARTSDGMANASRVVGAQFDNLRATIGQALLPVVERALGAINAGIAGLTEAWPKIQPVISRVMGQIGSAVSAVVAVIRANWPQIQQIATQVFGAVSSVVSTVVGAVSAAFPRITAAVKSVFDAVGPIVADIARLIADLAPKLKPAVDEVGRIIGSIADLVRAVANRVQQLWDKFGDEILAVVKFAFGRIVPIIKPLLATVRAVIETITALISGDWEAAWNGLKDIVSNALKAIWAVVRGAFDIAVTVAKELGERLLKGLWNALKGTASVIREGVVGGIRKLGDLGSALLNKGIDLGKKIIDGIVNAIKSGASRIASAVWDAIPGSGAVRDAVGDVLGFVGLSGGGMLPGVYQGRDTMLAALAPGEAVLNPIQQAMVPGGRSTLMEIFRRTGGRMGGGSFAGGGFVNPVPGGSWGGGPGQGTHSRSENGYIWQDDDAYDIFGRDGTPVVAGFNGVIGRISPFNSDSRYWGHGLYLSGGAGTLFYKHLKTVSVRSGQSVSAGTVLGTLGTGVNGGPHLHLGAQPLSLLSALRSGGVVSPQQSGGGRPDGDGSARNERQAPPPLSDRQKLARTLGQAVGRPGLGAGRKVSAWAGPLVSALSTDVPDVSGGLSGTSYTGPQSRSISGAARAARTEARRAGKSPEDVRAAGEEAERQAELKVLRQNRRAIIQARAALRKKKKQLLTRWRNLTRKPAKTAKGRTARRKATREIQAKLREYTAEINDCTEMIAEVAERMAELNEQAIEAEHEANYADGESGDGAGSAAGGSGVGGEAVDAGPTAGDFGSAAMAQAALTEGLDDDLAAAEKEELRLHHAYNAATYTGDPRLIGPAAQALLSARQTVKGIKEQIAAQQPTELDRLNLRAVEAQFTDNLGDDLQVAKDLEAYYQREVDKARATGDPRLIATALQALLSARQSREAIEENTGALKDNTDAVKGMAGSLTFAYRGQGHVLGSLAAPSSDRIENLAVGV